VGQPSSVEVVVPRHENLRLILEAPKGKRVNESIPVPLEDRPVVRIALSSDAGLVELAVETIAHHFEKGFGKSGHFEDAAGPQMEVRWTSSTALVDRD